MAEPAETVLISGEALCEALGIGRPMLARLVALAVVEPVAPGADAYEVYAVARLRRVLRLRRDLGVNLTGASIVVDLVDRLERLEAELERLRRRG
jgi:hypothetical protein